MFGLKKGFLFAPEKKQLTPAAATSETAKLVVKKDPPSSQQDLGKSELETLAKPPRNVQVPEKQMLDTLERPSWKTSSLSTAARGGSAKVPPAAKNFLQLSSSSSSSSSSSGVFSELLASLAKAAGANRPPIASRLDVSKFQETYFIVLTEMGALQKKHKDLLRSSATDLCWNDFLEDIFMMNNLADCLAKLTSFSKKTAEEIGVDFIEAFLKYDFSIYQQLAKGFIQKALELHGKHQYNVYKLYELWSNFAAALIKQYSLEWEFVVQTCLDNVEKLAYFIRIEIFCGFAVEHKFTFEQVASFIAEPLDLQDELLKNYMYYDPRFGLLKDAYTIFKQDLYLGDIFNPDDKYMKDFLVKSCRSVYKKHDPGKVADYTGKVRYICVDIATEMFRDDYQDMPHKKMRKFLEDNIDIKALLKLFMELNGNYDSNNTTAFSNTIFAKLFIGYLSLMVDWSKLENLKARDFTVDLFLAACFANVNGYFSLQANDCVDLNPQEIKQIISKHGSKEIKEFLQCCEKRMTTNLQDKSMDGFLRRFVLDVVNILWIYERYLLPLCEKMNFANLQLDRDGEFLKKILECLTVYKLNMNILENLKDSRKDLALKVGCLSLEEWLKINQRRLASIIRIEKNIRSKVLTLQEVIKLRADAQLPGDASKPRAHKSLATVCYEMAYRQLEYLIKDEEKEQEKFREKMAARQRQLAQERQWKDDRHYQQQLKQKQAKEQKFKKARQASKGGTSRQSSGSRGEPLPTDQHTVKIKAQLKSLGEVKEASLESLNETLELLVKELDLGTYLLSFSLEGKNFLLLLGNAELIFTYIKDCLGNNFLKKIKKYTNNMHKIMEYEEKQLDDLMKLSAYFTDHEEEMRQILMASFSFVKRAKILIDDLYSVAFASLPAAVKDDEESLHAHPYIQHVLVIKEATIEPLEKTLEDYHKFFLNDLKLKECSDKLNHLQLAKQAELASLSLIREEARKRRQEKLKAGEAVPYVPPKPGRKTLREKINETLKDLQKAVDCKADIERVLQDLFAYVVEQFSETATDVAEDSESKVGIVELVEGDCKRAQQDLAALAIMKKKLTDVDHLMVSNQERCELLFGKKEGRNFTFTQLLDLTESSSASVHCS